MNTVVYEMGLLAIPLAYIQRILSHIWSYVGATICRLLKIIGLFCRIKSLLKGFFAKRPIILRSLLIVATSYL